MIIIVTIMANNVLLFAYLNMDNIIGFPLFLDFHGNIKRAIP